MGDVLSPLTEAELHSGLRQVVNLVKTSGSTHSGGAVQFGPGTRGGTEM